MRDLNTREQFWFDQGYVSVRLAAEKTKRSIDTIYRAIDAAELDYKQDGKQKFVAIKSLVQWIGVDTARMYGLLPKSAAAK